MASSAAWADSDDARTIMREAAVQQAETVPPLAGPPTQAASNAKTRGNGGDGQATRGPDDHVPPGLSEAHRAAVAAARSEAALHANNPVNGPPGQSPARSANNGNAAADAGQRGAAAAAHAHAVHGNNGNGNGVGGGMGMGHGRSAVPPGGGKP